MTSLNILVNAIAYSSALIVQTPPSPVELRNNPRAFVGKTVEVCGDSLASINQTIVISSKGKYGRYGAAVGPGVVPKINGDKICVSGRFERVDGRTYEEASHGGVRVITDAIWDRNYWIRN